MPLGGEHFLFQLIDPLERRQLGWHPTRKRRHSTKLPLARKAIPLIVGLLAGRGAAGFTGIEDWRLCGHWGLKALFEVRGRKPRKGRARSYCQLSGLGGGIMRPNRIKRPLVSVTSGTPGDGWTRRLRYVQHEQRADRLQRGKDAGKSDSQIAAELNAGYNQQGMQQTKITVADVAA